MPTVQDSVPSKNATRTRITPLARSISSHILYLRRFSRVLTGSQASGDAYVLATLEAIVEDTSEFAESGGGRTALYRTFLRIWGSIPINDHVDQAELSADADAARHRLEAITLRPRIAFLLSALEGFDTAEVAAVLECTSEETAALLHAAGKEIAEQLHTDVLIIEDEPFTALDLKTLVEELGHRVVGMARTHREAVKAARRARPGLVISDIQLADGSSGLEAVNDILGASPVPVIFITDYPERYLTGTPPEPAFLVTKPFCAGSLKVVISQALFFDRKSHRRGVSCAYSGEAPNVLTGPWNPRH